MATAAQDETLMSLSGCRFVVWSSLNSHHLAQVIIIHDFRVDLSELDVFMFSACAPCPDSPPHNLSGCHGDVVRCCVPRRLVGSRVFSHRAFWEVRFPWGSLPVRFPVCLALHSPADGKCLLLITHRWTSAQTSVCTLVFVCLRLFISVIVYTRSSKGLPHLIVNHLLNQTM